MNSTEMSSSRAAYDALEPGPLRDELYPEEAAARRAEHEQQAQEQTARLAQETSEPLVFTGQGAEYFRIWIVNLALTVATLGIYSAWAKVRKTQYFWQNTQFHGHRFNYHGSPLAILRGRIIAVVLLLAYSWSFDISTTAAVIAVSVLCLVAPWLFLRAQEFRLRNTSYRGLRFGFDARAPRTYPLLFVLALLWFSATLAGLLLAQTSWVVALSLAPLLLFPWMHHSVKRLQHSRSSYGTLQASFTNCRGAFYSTYALTAVAFVFAIAASITVAVLLALPVSAAAQAFGMEMDTQTAVITGSAFGGALAYIMVFPLAAARIQRSVWTNTTLGPLWFHTDIGAGPYFKLVLKCALWTLLTLGLYWPFASVRLARYRVECLHVNAHLHTFPDLFSSVQSSQRTVRGDAAIDLFGVDVGL
jgi:uncharacterized membrane protein YjgN (DUF898 family)